jgi:hypothetical protein
MLVVPAMVHTQPFSGRLTAFGLRFHSALELPGFPAGAAAPAEADVRLERAGEGEIEAAWSGGDPAWRTSFADVPFELRAGAGGDHLFAYGEARFHLSGAYDRLLCDPGPAPPADWMRALLDTVLYSVALIRGRVALHAGSVELDAGAVALAAAMGSGKTTLAAELMARGGRLLSDDILFAETHEDRVLGQPGPPLMNLPLATELEGAATLERFGDEDERWVAVERVSGGPAPLAGIFLLERDERHHGARVHRLSPSPLPLLPHLVLFRHRVDAGAGFRFAADLATAVPLFGIEADPAATPAELAALVEQSVG